MGNVGGFSIGYSVRGGPEDPLALQKMSVAFDRAGADFSRFGEHVFPELSPVFESAVADQFLAEGKGPNRGKWAPLTPKYAAAKRKKHGVRPILVATGSLMAGLVDSASPYAQRVYSGSQFNYGTSGVPYASYHQTGTPKMTDRPVLDFGADFEKTVSTTARRVARKVARENLEEFVTVAP